eukprot:4875746-Karenia_brevis.AAC.1
MAASGSTGQEDFNSQVGHALPKLIDSKADNCTEEKTFNSCDGVVKKFDWIGLVQHTLGRRKYEYAC